MGSLEPTTDPPAYIIKTENGILQLINKDSANPGDILKFKDKNKEENYGQDKNYERWMDENNVNVYMIVMRNDRGKGLGLYLEGGLMCESTSLEGNYIR